MWDHFFFAACLALIGWTVYNLMEAQENNLRWKKYLEEIEEILKRNRK